MIQRLYRHPHLFGMVLMVPAVLVIFGLHSYTTGMYLLHYLYFRARDPICKSIEFDLIYIVAFISFFLAFPLALAYRIGVSVLQELHEQETPPFSQIDSLLIFEDRLSSSSYFWFFIHL